MKHDRVGTWAKTTTERNHSRHGAIGVQWHRLAFALLFAGLLPAGQAVADQAAPSKLEAPGALQLAESSATKDKPDLIGHRLRAVMERPRYRYGRWGLLAVDLDRDHVLQETAADDFFPIASNTKLFTMAAAFEVFGPDHRFETPVVYSGAIDSGGTLNGDLILVAQGDFTMGGRRNPDGTVAYSDFDHTDANPVGGAILTAPDPLAGLDDLAQQVADMGITSVSGDVIIDDRLFITIPHREFFLSPIVINDNLIDLSLTPQAAGEAALLDWRPHTSAFEVTSEVVTRDDPSVPLEIAVERVGDVTHLTITGEVATDALDGIFDPVRVYQVGDLPELGEDEQVAEVARFARTLFIEALERAGVGVAAATLGPNDSASLPSSAAVAQLPVAATLVSAPFSEFAKLVLKVSHNLGADTTATLIGVEKGVTHFFFAMAEMGKVLAEDFGLDPDSFAFTDASGSRSFATPRTVMKLLKEVRNRYYFDEFHQGLPILGVDGSLAVVQRGGPATGQVFGKTGTGVAIDFAHLQPFLTEKALGGYLNSAQGREVAYCFYVQNGLIKNNIFGPLTDIIEINDDIGEIATILWSGRY